MTTIPLLFDPKESLEILKYHNPAFWEVDIIGQRIEILRQVNKYNLSHTKALGNCISNCKNMASRILLMAAYQHIMDQKAVNYYNLCDKITRIRNQEIALNASTRISAADKKPIFEFYAQRIDQLENEKAVILECRETRTHLQLQYDARQASKSTQS